VLLARPATFTPSIADPPGRSSFLAAARFTINYVAKLLGEHEDWLHERHIDMFPEDGCLRVYSVAEDRPGLHRVWHRVPQANHCR
jgi:hypothetical protein